MSTTNRTAREHLECAETMLTEVENGKSTQGILLTYEQMERRTKRAQVHATIAVAKALVDQCTEAQQR